MQDNIRALSAFIEFHGFDRDAYGRGQFYSYVSLRYYQREISSDMMVRFSFFSDFEERLALEETGDFVAGQTPLGFKSDFGIWQFVSGNLIISGNYPTIGEYTLSVRPQ